MRRITHAFRRAVAASAAIGALGAAGIALGSDHQDIPEVELNPRMDLTDVYAFPGSSPDRIVLVMNTRAFLTPAQTPGASFDPDLLYQFKIDNTGDAVEDRVLQITFRDGGAGQAVELRGPVAPPVTGAMMNTLADVAPEVAGPINTVLGPANGVQVFAGPRDDPFFLDLEAAFCILPDRKPVTGPLAEPCALPANPNPPFYFRNPGVNYITGFNVLAIVVELPVSRLTEGGGSTLGVWGTISR
ncbi:MAG TPA: DUF4331 family protein [Gemmatimonadales bacterium]|nr:DUF4331 family protein [Gemmatimonadales bacterium]